MNTKEFISKRSALAIYLLGVLCIFISFPLSDLYNEKLYNLNYAGNEYWRGALFFTFVMLIEVILLLLITKGNFSYRKSLFSLSYLSILIVFWVLANDHPVIFYSAHILWLVGAIIFIVLRTLYIVGVRWRVF
jgi:hypothetical protein